MDSTLNRHREMGSGRSGFRRKSDLPRDLLGDSERNPELSQLRVARSFLISMAWHSKDVVASFEQGAPRARLLRSSENTVLHCLAACSRSFFSRLISTRVLPLVRLATGALPIPIT